jgi:hypothetical protein
MTEMEHITRSELQTMRATKLATAKSETVHELVRTIRGEVIQKATLGESKFIYRPKLMVGNAGRVGLQNVPILIDEIRDELIDALRRVFPDCNVEYVERRPVALGGEDIFKSNSVPKPYPSDNVDRAIVIDWS